MGLGLPQSSDGLDNDGGGTISTDAPTTRTTRAASPRSAPARKAHISAGAMAAMRRVLPALLLAVCAALAPGTAGATERVVEVPSEGPGPARFDRVFVHQVGPESAKRILVLMPGTIGGAGNFALLAQDLVERVPGLQVWSIDRRSQSLEDTSAFARSRRAGPRSRRPSTTTSAGSSTAASQRSTSRFSTPAWCLSPASGG